MSAHWGGDDLPEFGVWGDESTRNRVGKLSGPHAAPEPIEEYEASGRFAADPNAEPDPIRVAEMAARISANRDSLRGSPVTDQIEARHRLVESYSPGHERLGAIAGSGRTPGEWFATVIGAQRKPSSDSARDVAQQVASPLYTSATVVGCAPDGWKHARVATHVEVEDAARRFLPVKKKDTYCSFCHSNAGRMKPSELKALLRGGMGFWIHAAVVCPRCQDELDASAERIGIDLDWVGPSDNPR